MRKKKKRNLPQKNNPEQVKPFIEHFTELRTRSLIVLVALISFSIIGFIFRDNLIEIILTPASYPIYFNSPSGGLNFSISVSLIFGSLCSIPILVTQLLAFIYPAIPQNIKRLTTQSLIFSTLLLILGVLFAYFISIPFVLNFLENFSQDEIKSLITTKEYLSFLLTYMVGFGVLFQLPLIMYFINVVKKLNILTLLKFEKWVILLSFLIGAILTPTPDIFNQMLIAIPIIVLYQISILIIIIKNKFN